MSNTTTDLQFEAVTVPAGAFIGWHDQPGQIVTGRVTDFSRDGGQDFNGGSCPQFTLELIDPASSFNKAGDRTDFAAGETVTITAGQANLRRSVLAAQLAVGDVVRITRTANAKTANGTAKLFGIEVARGDGGAPSQAATASMNPAPPSPFPGQAAASQSPTPPF